MKVDGYLFNSLLDDRVNGEVDFGDFNILLQMEQRKFELGELLLGYGDTCGANQTSVCINAPKRSILTHLANIVLPSASRTYKRVKSRIDTVPGNHVQTLVWRLVSSEQVRGVDLSGEWRERVECRSWFDKCKRGHVRGGVHEMVICICLCCIIYMDINYVQHHKSGEAETATQTHLRLLKMFRSKLGSKVEVTLVGGASSCGISLFPLVVPLVSAGVYNLHRHVYGEGEVVGGMEYIARPLLYEGDGKQDRKEIEKRREEKHGTKQKGTKRNETK